MKMQAPLSSYNCFHKLKRKEKPKHQNKKTHNQQKITTPSSSSFGRNYEN